MLAVDVRDLLPVGHRVWDVLELVAELDLSAFAAVYRADGRGRPPYDPRMMLALVVYCRGKGICSGRGIEAACHDDLGARVITGNRSPDRATVDRFLDTHAQAIRALLPQTLRLGYAQDLVDVSLVAGDGTKALANAAMGATVDEGDPADPDRRPCAAGRARPSRLGRADRRAGRAHRADAVRRRGRTGRPSGR